MYSCIIIDDEPLAIEIIESYIEKIVALNLIKTFPSSLDAFHYLQQNKVDVVFIDLNMPKLSGLELISSLINKPKFIIISAFREYALEGYELDVTDYLVKPVPFERFARAVSKAINYSENKADANTNTPEPFIFVKANKKMNKIILKDILFLESKKDYIEIITQDSKIVARETISYFEEWLPRFEFVRVHRSFIISLSKIAAFNEEVIELKNKIEIPIGKTYRKTFNELIKSFINDKSPFS